MTKLAKGLDSAGATRRELEFVLSCGCALVNPEANERVRLSIQNGMNWPEVMAISEYNRLSTIVYEIVASTARDLISPEQLNALRQAAKPSMTSGMVLLRELLRMQKLFDGSGLLVIPYKGPLLALVAYGSFILRESSDLDFIVEQRHIPQIVALLKSADYVPQFDPQEAHAGEAGIAPGQYCFLSSPQKILVEIHTERTMRYFPVPIDFQELSSRLMTVEIGGQYTRTFSVEDTLVMLCVHGGKHFWERLGWVLDIAKLSSAQELDWTRVTRIAAKMESTRVLFLGLYLAHELFDAPVPKQLLGEIGRDRTVRELAKKVYEQYAGGPDVGAGVLLRAMFRFRSRDGVRQGLQHTLRLALSPTEKDRQTVRLPRWLTPFYLFVRPWRLLREYGSGWKRH